MDESAFNSLDPWLTIGPQTESRGADGDHDTTMHAAKELLQALVARGLLTTDYDRANHSAIPQVTRASETLLSFRESTHGTWNCLTHIESFLVASRRAHLALRECSLEETTRALRARRQERPFEQLSPESSKAKGLVRDFFSLRPLFPRNYLCLFDSLALLNFLLMHRISASWVFGVQAEPFAAHCWLQVGSTVLNDTVDNTSMYKPVMVV
jgi:hypothetical protein